MPPERLIAGIGNIFLGDDAFGVVVAKELAQRPLPAGVRVVDFGIRGFDLACALLDPWKQVILVDALPRGGQPGTVYVMQPEIPKEPGRPGAGFDPHGLHPAAVVEMVRRMGGALPDLHVVGCEPGSFEPDAEDPGGLSRPVRAAVAEAVRVIEELLGGGAGPGADCNVEGVNSCQPEKW